MLGLTYDHGGTNGQCHVDQRVRSADDVSDKEFVAWWVHTRDFLNARVGPIQTALHRVMSPDARFRFVNVAQLKDVDAWRAF